jgi:formiminoglutamate deiminase
MTELLLERALLPTGWASDVVVRIQDGAIAQVTPGAKLSLGAERINGATVPGMPNVHSHTFQRALAGLTEHAGDSADSFWTWRALMYRFLERLGPDDVEAIAAQAFVEMLETGFTGCCEFHYLHHDPAGHPYAAVAEMAERIVAAAEVAGIGLTLLPVYYADGGFGGAPPSEGQRRFLSDIDLYAKMLESTTSALRSIPDAVLGVAPHSLRAVSPEALREVVALAENRPIHIHVAEQQREVDDCVAWSGRRPVEWLLQESHVDSRWCLIHATHMTVKETRGLAASGGTAGLCPVTETNLGDGLFPAVDFRDAGGRFGVGSDSNVLIGVAEELRMLEYGQRLFHRRRNLLTGPGGSVGRSLLDGALLGGRAASGRTIGAIAPGHRADFVVLDCDNPALAGRDGDELLDAWIFAARQPPILEVWVGGRRVVEGGSHVRRDEVFNRYRATLHMLLG